MKPPTAAGLAIMLVTGVCFAAAKNDASAELNFTESDKLVARAREQSRTAAAVVFSKPNPALCDSIQPPLPQDLQQGFIEVPENWADPDSRRLRIFYYGRWGISADPATPVVLVINGGPGYSSHRTYRAMAAGLRRSKLSFVFFDQRGTGCSSSYPSPTDKSASSLTHYGSKDIVRDAEAIRKVVIEDGLWRVFGHSFGARAALRYVADFPRSVEKAVIMGDSVGDDAATTVCMIKESIRKRNHVFDEIAASKPEFVSLLKALHDIRRVSESREGLGGVSVWRITAMEKRQQHSRLIASP